MKLSEIANGMFKNQQTVDTILDKISMYGYASLTAKERVYLNMTSKGEKVPDEITVSVGYDPSSFQRTDREDWFKAKTKDYDFHGSIIKVDDHSVKMFFQSGDELFTSVYVYYEDNKIVKVVCERPRDHESVPIDYILPNLARAAKLFIVQCAKTYLRMT